MKDETIIRMIVESTEVLAKMRFPQECRYVQHSYNALLKLARANHPGDPFLSALSLLESDGSEGNPQEMYILFAQLRIALESLQEALPPGGSAAGAGPAGLPAPQDAGSTG